MTDQLTRLKEALKQYQDRQNWNLKKRNVGGRLIFVQEWTGPGSETEEPWKIAEDAFLPPDKPLIRNVSPNPIQGTDVLEIWGYWFGEEPGSLFLTDTQGMGIGGEILMWHDDLIRIQLPGVGTGTVAVQVETRRGRSNNVLLSIVL